jgi:ketosteroid isomerase-like protein
MSQTDRQQVAADAQAIQHLRARYSHTIDHGIETGEWDEFLSLYTDDAVVDYPQATLEGLDEIEAFARELEAAYEFTMHTAQMPDISVDGDEATGHWYLMVFYAATDGSEGYALGRYEDDYRRVDGDWHFSGVKARVTYDNDGFHL